MGERADNREHSRVDEDGHRGPVLTLPRPRERTKRIRSWPLTTRTSRNHSMIWFRVGILRDALKARLRPDFFFLPAC